MKYRYLLFLCALFCTTLLSAQVMNDAYEAPAEISWGNELRQPNNTSLSKIIPTANGFYGVREKYASNTYPNFIILERYDNDMQLVNTKPVDLRYKSKKRVFEDLILLDGQLYLLTSFNNEAKKKNYLFAQKINDQLVLNENFTKVGEIDSKNKELTGEFGIHISRDSSKLLIYNELPYKRSTPEQFALRIYNDKFEEMWTKDIVLPYNDAQFEIRDYRIDNNGNVYLLGKLFENGNKAVRKGKPNYKYIILTYTQAGEDVEKYKISLSNKFITDLTFRVDNEGHLVCSGFFSDIGTQSVKGTYFFRLNPETRQIYNQNQKEFDFNFITENLSKKKKEKARKAKQKGEKKRVGELYQYALDHLILRSDGGAVLVAEQYYEERINVNENRRFGYLTVGYPGRYNYGNNYYDRFYNNYNYNDIIVVNIKPNGEIEWTARIPKRQESTDDIGYFSSYAMSIVRDKFFFVYNENPRNFDPEKKPGKVYNFDKRQSVVACTQLNRDGTIQTVPLFSNRDADIITRPKICKQTGSKQMVIYGERNRKYKFAKLNFK